MTKVNTPPAKVPNEVKVATRTSLLLYAELPVEVPTGEVLAGAKIPTTTEDPTGAGNPATPGTEPKSEDAEPEGPEKTDDHEVVSGKAFGSR